MLRQNSIEDHSHRPGWTTSELRGGPAAGQLVSLHRLQDRHTIYAGAVAHNYYRIGRDSVLWHESVIAKAFGGGKR